MKRIAYTILCCSTLLTGCQTAQFPMSKLNPASLLPDSQEETESQAEIEQNSKQFLAEIKKDAASDSAQVEQYIQQGQQEIVSWYQDQDDRHIDAAKNNFRSALKLQPKGNVDALHGLAVVADLEKNFQVAEQHYQLALAQSPGDSTILGNLGYSYLLQNRFEESERYLSRATQIDPGNVDAVKHLGEVYVQLGQPGRAQSVLAKVMSPDEARQIVASQTVSSPVEESESLATKLFSRGKSVSQDSLQQSQIHTARVNDPTRQQMMQFHNSASGYQYPPNMDTQLTEQQLKARLASIDQERHQNLNGGPVIISSQSERMDSHSAVDLRGPQLRANAPHEIPQQQVTSVAYQNYQAQLNQNPVDTQNQYSEMSPYQQQQFARSQQIPANSQQTREGSGHYGVTNQTPHSQGNSSIEQRTHRGERYAHSSNTDSNYQMSSPDRDPLQRPWGRIDDSNATHVNYEQQQMMQPYPGPQELDNSQIHGRSIDMSEGTSQSRRHQEFENQHHARQNFLQAARHRQANHQMEQTASMQAAKLGMGVGPGNMFPEVNETAPSHQPGMQSTWNGGSFEQAPRMLPTDVAPLDLSQANGQQPTRNSMGQQLPGSHVTNELGQFGTGSRFDQQMQARQQQNSPFQQSQLELQRQQLQMDQQLREQRQHSQSQLNQQTHNTWNQRPLTPHTPSAGGSELLSPAEYGGMVPVNQATTHNNGASPYPYSHRPENMEQGRQSANGQVQYGQIPSNMNRGMNHYYDAAPDQNVIEPPPYRASQNTHESRYRDQAIQQIGYTNSQNVQPAQHQNSDFQYRMNSQQRSQNGMPMIVPGGP